MCDPAHASEPSSKTAYRLAPELTAQHPLYQPSCRTAGGETEDGVKPHPKKAYMRKHLCQSMRPDSDSAATGEGHALTADTSHMSFKSPGSVMSDLDSLHDYAPPSVENPGSVKDIHLMPLTPSSWSNILSPGTPYSLGSVGTPLSSNLGEQPPSVCSSIDPAGEEPFDLSLPPKKDYIRRNSLDSAARNYRRHSGVAMSPGCHEVPSGGRFERDIGPLSPTFSDSGLKPRHLFGHGTAPHKYEQRFTDTSYFGNIPQNRTPTVVQKRSSFESASSKRYNNDEYEDREYAQRLDKLRNGASVSTQHIRSGVHDQLLVSTVPSYIPELPTPARDYSTRNPPSLVTTSTFERPRSATRNESYFPFPYRDSDTHHRASSEDRVSDSVSEAPRRFFHPADVAFSTPRQSRRDFQSTPSEKSRGANRSRSPHFNSSPEKSTSLSPAIVTQLPAGNTDHGLVIPAGNNTSYPRHHPGSSNNSNSNASSNSPALNSCPQASSHEPSLKNHHPPTTAVKSTVQHNGHAVNAKNDHHNDHPGENSGYHHEGNHSNHGGNNHNHHGGENDTNDNIVIEDISDVSEGQHIERLLDERDIKQEPLDVLTPGVTPGGSSVNEEGKHLCQVCGDTAAGFHCGAYVCEACKKFFVRCVKSENLKFNCPRARNCEITRETRTRCQYCRYIKCIGLGMYKPGGTNVSSQIGHIPCNVCSAPSSGFHFGAITCEGCKGFFRRTVKERDMAKYECSRQGNCAITTATRNICKFCRYQKCLTVGMKANGSRIGRQPNAVKHATLMQLQEIKIKKGLALDMGVKPEVKQEVNSEVKHNVDNSVQPTTPIELKPNHKIEPEINASVNHRIVPPPSQQLANHGLESPNLSRGDSAPWGHVSDLTNHSTAEDQIKSITPKTHTNHRQRNFSGESVSSSHLYSPSSSKHSFDAMYIENLESREPAKKLRIQSETEEQLRARFNSRVDDSVFENRSPYTQQPPPHSQHLLNHPHLFSRSQSYDMAHNGPQLSPHLASLSHNEEVRALSESMTSQSMTSQHVTRDPMRNQHEHSPQMRRYSEAEMRRMPPPLELLPHNMRLDPSMPPPPHSAGLLGMSNNIAPFSPHKARKWKQHPHPYLPSDGIKLPSDVMLSNAMTSQALPTSLRTHQPPQYSVRAQLNESDLNIEVESSLINGRVPINGMDISNFEKDSDNFMRQWSQESNLSDHVQNTAAQSSIINDSSPQQEIHTSPQSLTHSSSQPHIEAFNHPNIKPDRGSQPNIQPFSHPNIEPDRGSPPSNTVELPRRDYLPSMNTIARSPDLPERHEVLFRVQEAYRELMPILRRCPDIPAVFSPDCTLLDLWDIQMAQFKQCAFATVKFAKLIPGFKKLPGEIQIARVQECMYPIVMTVLASKYELERSQHCYFNYTEAEEAMILRHFPWFADLISTFHVIGFPVQELRMDNTELSFLCALKLFSGCKKPQYEDMLIEALEDYCEGTHMDNEHEMEAQSRVCHVIARLNELARINHIHHKTVLKGADELVRLGLSIPQLFQEAFLND